MTSEQVERIEQEEPPIEEPNVGRKVWFYGNPRDFPTGILNVAKPFDATVIYVTGAHNADGAPIVNLRASTHVGGTLSLHSVPLYNPHQSGDCHGNGTKPGAGYATWMPFQSKGAFRRLP